MTNDLRREKRVGPISDNMSCIWCMEGYDKRHHDNKNIVRSLVNLEIWNRIVASVRYIKDTVLRNCTTVEEEVTSNTIGCFLNSTM